MNKLSFCITCKNRICQIRQTLPKNILDNKTNPYIEFVLVNFGSNDGLHEYVLENFSRELSEGYLSYYHTDSMSYWHSSIAKNTAHSCATGDILVNLDCDNYTGKDGGKHVIKQFVDFGPNIVLHQFSGKWKDGSFGRIAITKENFFKIGGYDETFLPMGFQDFDLINRAIVNNVKYKLENNSIYNTAIANTKELGLKFVEGSITYDDTNRLNMLKSRKNIYEGKTIANINSIVGIKEDMYKFVSNMMVKI